jgi:D-serine deaminase-like pyridoxal phosphate-dependent protein
MPSGRGFECPVIGESVERLDTPALVVDLDPFDANLHGCMNRLAGQVAVRPHLKTAKSPAVARRMLAAGAGGICVAKLGEAEIMLDAGIEDVTITTEIVGGLKAQRLARLLCDYPRQRLAIVVDNADAARTASWASKAMRVTSSTSATPTSAGNAAIAPWTNSPARYTTCAGPAIPSTS